MKKMLSVLLAASMMVPSASALNLYFDSKPMETDVPAQIIQDRTMVPIARIFNAHGAEVTWDGETKTAVGKKDGTEVVLQIGNKVAMVNGMEVTLDVPAMIVNDRTMVPAAFVSTALGSHVYWDGETKTVRIAPHVYTVTRVIDGDTIVIDYNGKEEKVRLIGVDTPESVHPDQNKNTEAGILASEYTKGKLLGKEIELEFDIQERDKYGRLLAYVWVDGIMYNKTLLKEGVANLATYPPNVAHLDEFRAIIEARKPEQPEQKPEQPEQKPEQPEVKPSQPEAKPVPSEKPGYNGPGTGNQNLQSAAYIGNVNSMVFHYPNCPSVKRMSESNKIAISNRQEAIDRGFTSCGKCNP